MRRILALTCAAVALAGSVVLGGGGAAGVPAPVASPPLGDDYYTSRQMERGLPGVADLPAGWTVATSGPGVGLSTLDLCTFMAGGPPFNTTIVTRTYVHRGGARLTVDIVASGAESARRTVTETAAVPRTCPTATNGDGLTRRNTALPLPATGDASAGVISVPVSAQQSEPRVYSAVVALGQVWAGFLQTGGEQAGFAPIVTAGTSAARRISAAPTTAELERALLTTADLPAGFRQTSAADTREFFTADDCAGKPVDHGTPATFVHRTFVQGDVTVRVAAGTAERAGALIKGMACPSFTALKLPATDLTTNAGVVYPGRPVRARAVFVYREVFTELVATVPDRAGIPAIEKILEDGWLGKVFAVYYPENPTGRRVEHLTRGNTFGPR
ncbi:hypothetical protein [Actinoplanes couchii]|uniref:hypothetical protein n=1 Tax=Actinoplanes couchii TaxID=403638 RepID=UPI001940FE64|nr:hypothetical protein [Actinoplanes couchii]MDR6317099.1 hypothetical protein [Actinoplanes couchii]